eukprot:evm.model.scf_1517.2 EVM.evm.TU.scf_1517.2   scf_1517:12950-17246(+)
MARRALVAWAFVAILALEAAVNLALEPATNPEEGWTLAPRTRFPGVVQVRGPRVRCVGMLIGPQRTPSSNVLTSAVCAEAVGPQGTVAFSANGTFDLDAQEISVQNVTVHPLWPEKGTCSYDVAILELEQAADAKTGIIARSPVYAAVPATVTIFDPRNELNFASPQVVAGKELCPGLADDVEQALCIRMETGSIVPGANGSPVIDLDLPPERDMENGDPHIDMVVAVLSGVDQFPTDGGSAACAAEISRHARWIEEVVSQTCKAQVV